MRKIILSLALLCAFQVHAVSYYQVYKSPMTVVQASGAFKYASKVILSLVTEDSVPAEINIRYMLGEYYASRDLKIYYSKEDHDGCMYYLAENLKDGYTLKLTDYSTCAKIESRAVTWAAELKQDLASNDTSDSYMNLTGFAPEFIVVDLS